ncbi:MAG: magnesium chelatase [Bacteroidia bacterium]
MAFSKELLKINTFGSLKASGYTPRSVKDELRSNLIEKMQKQEPMFQGVLGYEETVIPDLQRAILARHNIILLRLRGQAKTRIARQMVDLLDAYIPVVEGSELNDDPFQPLSRFARDLVAEKGDDTPISWLPRAERYSEKLATPDVSVADLIGDVDPIKAATLKLPYSDERVIHYGIIPRSHRGLFVINELPDLQPRIQVALFNILQEGDIQIRGFKLRLPLDIQFVFTANPEDYTNRGSIVTPLKDRIESQILTHYPKSEELSMQITAQEARLPEGLSDNVYIDTLSSRLVERIAMEARNSEFVDAKSGVSARLTISAYEILNSAVERRILINKEKKGVSRIGDLHGLIPAITGKIELVYEGEQEGPALVAEKLISNSIRSLFAEYFPNPEMLRKRKEGSNPYEKIIRWFGKGNSLDLMNDLTQKEYNKLLLGVPGLEDIVEKQQRGASDDMKLLLMEFVLHGLSSFSLIGKNRLESGNQFGDLLSGMLNFSDEEEDDSEYGGYYE